MNKYIAKATYMRDQKGLNYTVEELICDGSHEGGSSSGSSNIDSSQLKNLETRVTTVETTANDAKRTAEIAHNVADEVSNGFDMLNSMVSNAESKAVEAKSIASSISTAVENLKTRVSNLEEMDGQPSVPNVGKSTMGYNSDFTEYGGGDYKYVEWGDEGRSISFGEESLLGDILEEMIYYTTTGITANYNKIRALQESGTGSSGDSGNCLEQNITFKPYIGCSDEGLALMGVEKDKEETAIVKNTIEVGFQAGTAAMFQAKVHDNKISDLDSRVTTLENNSDSSGGETSTSEYTIARFSVGKNIDNKYEFQQPELVTVNKIEDGLAIITANDSSIIEVVESNLRRLNALEVTASCSCPSDTASQLTSHANSINSLDTRTTSQGASITSLETRMTDVETSVSNLKVNGSNCTCDFEALRTDCQELSTYTVSNFNNVYSRLSELKNAIVNDLDSIWQELMRTFDGLPNKGSTCPEDPWQTSSV